MPISRVSAALAVASLGLALGIAARPAAAETAVTIDSTTPYSYLEANSASNGGFTGTLGWEFSPTQNLSVTSLGYFDDMGTGAGAMTGSHAVGLYDTLGNELGMVTVTPTDTADGLFRYATLSTPVNLTAGTDYVLGGVAGTDNYAYAIQNNSFFAPQVNYLQDAYDPNNTAALTFPTASDGSLSDPNSTASQSGNGYAYFGPNFQFTPNASPAPEPSEIGTMGLLGLGLGGLLLRGRRRAARTS